MSDSSVPVPVDHKEHSKEERAGATEERVEAKEDKDPETEEANEGLEEHDSDVSDRVEEHEEVAADDDDSDEEEERDTQEVNKIMEQTMERKTLALSPLISSSSKKSRRESEVEPEVCA